MAPMKVVSLFAGIGGICLGFKKAGAQIVWANEIDAKACTTYRHFFHDSDYLQQGDIYDYSVPDGLDVDIVVAGFPCQAFSIAGYRKGFDDERGVLYTQVHRIINETRPKAVFLENVKNLMTHDNGNTYRVIRGALESSGYDVIEKVLNSCDYGNVPQNRERIYVVAFRREPDGSCPMMDRFSFPQPIALTNTLDKVIDYDEKKPDKYYYPLDHKYYPLLDEAMDDDTTVYQWRRVYVRKNQSHLCPTLTANMGTGGHNVPIIRDHHGIRKLTPQECLAMQGFPEEFVFPDNIPDSAKYKQAGNSVTVTVIEAIARKIIEAMGGLDG